MRHFVPRHVGRTSLYSRCRYLREIVHGFSQWCSSNVELFMWQINLMQISSNVFCSFALSLAFEKFDV